MEGLEIYTVELYLKVRLACADGMSKRAAARHFNISRDTVDCPPSAPMEQFCVIA
jgi:hypothetical protein